MTRRVIALVFMVFVVGMVARRRVLASELAGVRSAWTNSHGTARSFADHSDDSDPLPASSTTAAERLAKSPRHREYVSIPTPGAPGDSLRAWVFYPQVSGKAPVVVVIHEVYGMTTWIKAVGDQVAADGFIAIVPDLIHRPMPPGSPDTMAQDAAVTAIRALDPAAVQRDILAAATYATSLPSALPLYATVGFCWGGSQSFLHDVYTPSAATPRFKAAVVYYGGTPDSTKLPMARGPVLGLYGGNDARLSLAVPGTDSAMQRLHKTYTGKVYQGAGHGFLRAQEGENGANAAATSDAWPRTLAWFRQYLVS